MTNFAQALWLRADEDPTALALREGDRSWTYAEVCDHSASYAARLTRAGVDRGDRVVLVAPSTPEFVFAYWGILAAGAIAVTANPMCTESELGYFIDDAEAALVIAWGEVAGPARAASHIAGVDLWTLSPADFPIPSVRSAPVRCDARDDADPAVLLYTSGTTGRPKGAVLTHGNLRAATTMFQDTLRVTSADRLGTSLPLFHVFGQVAVMGGAFQAGCSLSILRRFSGSGLLEMAAAHGSTILSGVPTMWIEMLHADTDVQMEDLGALRLASSGGAALPQEVARAFKARFGATVLDGYGLSETASATTFTRPGRPAKEGSVGQALPGMDVVLLNESGEPVPAGETGEIAIRGPVVMARYWRQPEATAAVMRGGWFMTGDLGRMDEDGYLWIVDRTKDMVIRGGYNVYPREIEELLYEHPSVQEAAVVGVPDERLGEEVAAVLVLKDGADIDLEALRPWLETRLAEYKVPRLYQVVDSLPRGATGKILKREIDREAVYTAARRIRRHR